MADPPPPEASAGLGPSGPRRKRAKLEFVGLQLQCPCCYRPGKPFCDTCEPEDAAKKLAGLRALMSAHGLDAYIVTSGDAHSSEYTHPADERRSFLTGFSGSAGTALVTQSQALLWTDSRYFLQAEEQLRGTDWQLMRQYQPGVMELREWIPAKLEGRIVGVDPAFLASELGEEWRTCWTSKSVVLKEVSDNLVDAIWTSRPDDPCTSIQIHPMEFAGESVQDKIKRVQEAFNKQGAAALILSALDQIAWLFNLRGSDIACNPVFFSYAIVSSEKTSLFVRPLDEGRPGLSEDVVLHLRNAAVDVQAYSSFFASAPALLSGKKVLVEPSTCSLAVLQLVPPEMRVKGVSPVETFKAQKNDIEIKGIREACKRDSVALCEFLALLELRLADPEIASLSEVAAAQLITDFRKKQPLYVQDSFPTISSAGSNSSIVHYHAEPDKCKSLAREDVYLVDTGGQYKDGTTDVTRTWHYGTASAEQKHLFTRVLQGHMALANAVFPQGTPGLMLDTLARQPLWKDGLQYGHGTSHGMGAYLNVHEGPMGIGGGTVSGGTIQGNERMKRIYLSPLEPGHFLSNEPGCYKDGEFGIRIESDLVVVPADTPYQMGGRKFLKFEYMTLVPMCKELLDTNLLAQEEVQWLNTYHQRIWETLQSDLSNTARDWLARATSPVKRPSLL